MARFLARIVFAALGLWLASSIVPGVGYDRLLDLIIAALLLGLVNAVLRPILFILTLPLTNQAAVGATDAIRQRDAGSSRRL